jgi:hypothetical protein
MKIIEIINTISTREDLVNFLDVLKIDLDCHPEEWENISLEKFLESMAAWVRSLDNYAKNTGDMESLTPNWKTFAKILYAAKIYE